MANLKEAESNDVSLVVAMIYLLFCSEHAYNPFVSEGGLPPQLAGPGEGPSSAPCHQLVHEDAWPGPDHQRVPDLDEPLAYRL